MAFSVEARVPFLDRDLVEYAAALPLSQKIRGGVTKVVLRNAIRGLVPDLVRNRMDKMGFVTPEEVLMKGDLKPFILSIFRSGAFKLRPYWNADAVLESFNQYCDGKSEYSPELWRIACTELWLTKFFDNRQLCR